MTQRMIFMADVVSSSKQDPSKLQRELKRLTAKANADESSAILSPLVTTLGDEFQGLTHNLKSAVHLVFQLESYLRSRASPLKLRYVLHEGDISTPVNLEVAYGMLGEGLSAARDLLSTKGRNRVDFNVRLKDQRRAKQLERTLSLLETLREEWSIRDLKLVNLLIREPSDQKAAKKLGRNRTSVYRRRRSLRIADYLQIRALSYELATIPSKGKDIAALRKHKKHTRVQLARAAGLSTKELTGIEQNARSPTILEQRKLDLALGYDLPELFADGAPK